MPGGLRYNIRREGFDVGSSRRHDFLLAGLGCQTEANSGGFNVVWRELCWLLIRLLKAVRT